MKSIISIESTFIEKKRPDGSRGYLNGLISAQTFSMAEAPLGQGSASGEPRSLSASWDYSYSGSRLTEARYSETGRVTLSGNAPAFNSEIVRDPDYSETYSLDPAGNLLSLSRKGFTGISYEDSPSLPSRRTKVLNFGVVDDLRLLYDGYGRLRKVTDLAQDPVISGASDFADGADGASEYSYDEAGNMTSDLNKGITAITYNHLNQPLEISYGEGKTARYTYDAAGRRLSLEHGAYTWVVDGGLEPVNPGIGGGSGTGLATAPATPGESAPSGESSGAPSAISRPGKPRRVFTAESRRDYCGAFLYADGALERILTDNGWYSPGGTYTAVINDHQGNLRATASWKFSSSSSDSGIGVIEFGAPAKDTGSPASAPGTLTADAGANAGTANGNGAGTASPQGIGTIGGPIGGGIVVPVDPNRNRRYSNLTAYSPYGLPLADWQGDDERYLYSGKELDRDGGLWLYDFHARQYDPQLGRFTTPDPLQEKYLPLSPGRFPSHLP